MNHVINLPLVSIIIPTYNAKEYISKTIDSCLSQDYERVEIIVIDDNSVDETVEEVKKFGDKVTLICNNNNRGLPKNINEGVLNCSGEFFIYLGHDDLLHPNHITKMVEEFEQDTVAVHCNSWKIDAQDAISKKTKNDAVQFKKTRNIYEELALNNFISIVGMLHRTNAFNKIGGWDENYNLYGEWLYYTRLATVGSIKYTDKISAYYRQHESNISSSLYSRKRNWSFFKYKLRCRLSALKQCDTHFVFFLFSREVIKDIRKHLIALLKDSSLFKKCY